MARDFLNNSQTVTIGDWLLTYIITCIPVVNIIMLIIWSLSDSTKQSKANWARCMLLITVIGLVVTGVIMLMNFMATGALLSIKK